MHELYPCFTESYNGFDYKECHKMDKDLIEKSAKPVNGKSDPIFLTPVATQISINVKDGRNSQSSREIEITSEDNSWLSRSGLAIYICDENEIDD